MLLVLTTCVCVWVHLFVPLCVYRLKEQKTSYYLTKVCDNYLFFIVYDTNKQENKTKTVGVLQEISNELNFNYIFLCLNSNLK